MGINIIQIIQGILLTIGALLSFVAIVNFGNIIFDREKLHRNLRLKKHNKFLEFTIFKFCLYILLAYWLIIFLLYGWGAPAKIIDTVRSGMLDGTRFYSVKIIPMRLIIALMVYSIIQMAWKYTLLYFSRSEKYDPNADTQVILTSLLSYGVFAISVICGLLVSGVDFTGLAIVAGALSLGIGFGLQNIVSNFVSGIIILIEHTITPGDRVLIKGYEGFVKEISFRYTRIETLLKEDVLIPNSDLMTTPIINYEYETPMAKLKCFVGASYDSDLDLVKQTLLNVALKHPNVLHDPINAPVVYMNEFGDCNIQFELSCVVDNVNKRSDIRSDLNFMIAKAFKENKIAMGHPRRDVHIIQET